MTEHSEEFNTIMNFASDLERIGVASLTTNDMRKYASAAEAQYVTSMSGFDDFKTIEDLNG